MVTRSLAGVAIALALLGQGTSSTLPLTGRVETRARSGTAAVAAVVYAEPLDARPAIRAGTFTVAQKNKSFVPRVLGAPVGSTITFPNADSIFHNVFSLSQPQPFDLGLYRSGASETRTFSEPAAYYIFCNIHPQMVAFVVVAPTPWITTAAADGSWRLDVPAGRYRLSALSERAALVSAEVTVRPAGTAAVVLPLDESTFSTTPHLNKFGKPYPAAAYRDKSR
jgi:plastocyanin